MSSSSSLVNSFNGGASHSEGFNDAMPDKLQAAAQLGRFICNGQKHYELGCGVPLFTLFTNKLTAYLSMFNNADPQFFDMLKAIFSEDAPGPCSRFITYFQHPKFHQRSQYPLFRHQATLYIFSRLLSDSISDGPSKEADFSKICSLLAFLRAYIQFSLGPEDLESIDYLNEFLEKSANVLEFNDPDLLLKTPLELGLGPTEHSKTQSYRSTIKNFIFVFAQMNTLLAHLKLDQELSENLPAFSGMQTTMIRQMRTIYEAILQNKAIPTRSKVELFFHMRRHCVRICDNFKKIELMKARMFASDSLKYYRDVICSEKAQAIALTRVEMGMMGTSSMKQHEISFDYDSDSPVFPTYAEENREAYEFFLTRIREMVEYLSSASNQAKNDLLIIQNAPDYFRRGEVGRLLSRLNSSRGSQDKADAVIYNEIMNFSRASLSAEAESGLPILPTADQVEFEQMEEMLCSASKVIKVFLSDKIHREKEWNSNLFSHPYGKAPRRHPRAHPQIQKSLSAIEQELATSSSSDAAQTLPTLSSSSSNSCLPTSSTPTEESAATSSSTTLSPSFTLELEQNRKLLQSWIGNLSRTRSPFTADALKNSYEHFDNLLCSLRRVHNLALREPIAQGDLFAFVNDSVRHCTLGVEQLLSALFRETNGIKTKEALAPHLTHDLFEILQKCDMGIGDLPPDVRRWIGEINRGEIAVRDFQLISERDSVLHHLLRSNHHLMSGPASSSESPENVKPLLEALFDYLSPLGDLLETIQNRFPAKGPSASVPLGEPLRNLFESFYTQMDQVPIAPPKPLPDDGPLAYLNQVRAMLMSKLSSDPNGILENALSNLLVHLETEALSHAHLEPIEASLHFGNVLLLNQLIAEAVLIHAVHSKVLPLNLVEENEHDLFALVQKLQIEKRFSKEELDFLKSGKTSRQFIRYPASYSKPRSSKAPLSRLDKMLDLLTWGRTLANKQASSEDLRGFTSGSHGDAKKLQEVKAFAANDIKLLCSIVKKILS
ncbi:MAG: hypothetical protein JSR39_01920 [Verrucomicrobia bacterium]|nr:hypothetical protein [Verrucomicrobiota bacterium]